jgi:hypothetical protein
VLTNGVCTNAGGQSITVTAPVAGRVIISGFIQLLAQHTNPNNDELDVFIGLSASDCSSQYSGGTVIPSAMPTANNYFFMQPLHGDFSVAAGSTTFFLNEKPASGAGFGTGPYAHNVSRMTATFVPN